MSYPIVEKLKRHFKNHYLDIVVELSKHFEEQVKNPNNYSDPLGHCAFVIFPLCLDFFEALGQLLEGRCSKNTETVDFFKIGYDFVFADLYRDQSICPPYPILDDQTIKPLVTIARNGMAHSLIPNGPVSINGEAHFSLSIETIQNQKVVVCNAIELPRLLARRFDDFLEELSEPSNQLKRDNVEKLWNHFASLCRVSTSRTTENPAHP